MANDSVILRFSDVNYEYGHSKHILEEVSFSVRTGSRVTLMGQNGAGKSTLFKMVMGEIEPRFMNFPEDSRHGYYWPML